MYSKVENTEQKNKWIIGTLKASMPTDPLEIFWSQ